MGELGKMEEEGLLPDDTESLPMFAAARPGCTPFEFINFTDESIEHDIAITVRQPADILQAARSAETPLREAACRLHTIDSAASWRSIHTSYAQSPVWFV